MTEKEREQIKNLIKDWEIKAKYYKKRNEETNHDLWFASQIMQETCLSELKVLLIDMETAETECPTCGEKTDELTCFRCHNWG